MDLPHSWAIMWKFLVAWVKVTGYYPDLSTWQVCTEFWLMYRHRGFTWDRIYRGLGFTNKWQRFPLTTMAESVKITYKGNIFTRWRHQVGTFSELLALCEGNPPITGGFPSQRLVTRSFDVFFDLRLNKRLSKTIETPVVWDAIAVIMTSL